MVPHPLYAMTRKDVPFVWTSQQEEAFHLLKGLLTEAFYPDVSRV